ncbi:MAG: endonuclease V [Clostridiaceae bacterium]
MEIKNIHGFEVKSEEQFLDIQNNLLKKIRLINNFKKEKIHFCAGADLAYWEKDGEQYGVCSIVVIDYKTKEMVEKVYSHGKISTPYVAGFLAFRELPLIIEAAKKLTLEPDIFVFDGNGYLHFNHMGIATHASFFLNKPTIGAAKSYLKVRGTDFQMPGDDEGSYSDIVINGEVYGRVLRTSKGVKPIFISCGNYIDLETCTEIVAKLVNKESRLPIPVRLAHLETHLMRNELK